MTRKHFKAIAEALKHQRPIDLELEAAFICWQTCVIAMADVCSSFNGQFDRSRFYTACGYTEGE